MSLPQAKFITSATNLEQCPDFGRPEYAVVGRSNVGKSSLINTIANQRALARTSRTPGRTQLINFFDFGPFVLVDLPGYGYAKVSKTQQAYWRKELSRYLRERKALAGVIQLMDARHPLQENDRQMMEFLLAHEVPILIVLTKVDDVKQGELVKSVRLVTEAIGDAPLLFSSKTGRGKKELLKSLVDGVQAEPAIPAEPDAAGE